LSFKPFVLFRIPFVFHSSIVHLLYVRVKGLL
jgi:hypothetical protein